MKKQLGHIKNNLSIYKHLVIVLIVFVSIYFVYHQATNWCKYQDFFALDSATIGGNILVDENHIITTGNIHKDMNILTTDCKAIRNNLETHPYVKAAIVSKRFPNKMDITIKERLPIAYLNAGRLMLIDGEGIVLPIPDANITNQLPVITVVPDSVYKIIPGEKLSLQKINPITDLVIDTYSMSRALFSTISEIRYNLHTGELILFNKDNGNPIYLGNDNFAKKMRSLANFQKILAGKKRLRDYRYIDLRWSQQIVVKEL